MAMAEQTLSRRSSELPRLVTVFKREYLERVRTKWFIISTMLIPVLIGVTSILPVWLAARTKASDAVTRIVVLDATGAGLGDRVSRALTSDSARAAGAKGPEVRVVDAAAIPAAEAELTQRVQRKELPGFLILDAATMAGDSARYAGRNASTVPDVERIRTAVREAVVASRLETAGLQASRVNELTRARVRLPAIRITDKGKSGAGGVGGFIVGFMLAFILYMVMALYGQQVLRGVMEEKTTRVAEVVVSSVKPSTLMAGKVLGVGAVAITQQLLWVGISGALLTMLAPVMARLAAKGGTAAAAGASTAGQEAAGRAMISGMLPSMSAGTIAAIAIFFVLGYLFYASLFAAVGATVNSEQDAQQASAPIAFLLIPSIVFVQPIALNPTGTLAQVMSFLPFSAPIIMPMRMAILEVPLWEVALSMLSAALGCALALWFAARIYRVGLLMYGKRPTYGELVKWLRYA